MATTWNDEGVNFPSADSLSGTETLPALTAGGTPVVVTVDQLAFYANAASGRQSLSHSTAGALTINMANGHNVVVSATANITDHVWTTDPGFGAVVALLYRNTGAASITVNLDSGFRVIGSSSLGEQTIHPGGELFVSATSNDVPWTTADPFLRDVTKFVEGSAPQPTGVSLHNKWHLHQASATSIDIPDTAIANTAGTTGLIIVTGSRNPSTGEEMTLGTVTGWTRIERYVPTTYDNAVIDVLKRDMDGTATDFPTLTSTITGSMRAVGLITLNGTSAALLNPANAWTEHASGSSFDPPSFNVATANSLVLTALAGRWGTAANEPLRVWTGPSNMTSVINTGGQNQRPLLVSSTVRSQTGSFNPEPFALIQGGDSEASTRSFIAAPA